MKDKFAEANKNKYNAEANAMTSVKRRQAFVKSYSALTNYLELTDNSKVVDLGCGTGNLAEAVSFAAQSYIGYDISEEAIMLAKERDLNNCSFNCLDLFSIPLDFDTETVLISISCIDQMGNRKEFLEYLSKHLSKSNKVYIEVRNKDYLFKKLLGFLNPILHQTGFLTSLPADEMTDLSFFEWKDVFSETGFEIIEVRSSVRPYYFESWIEFIKITLHEIAKFFPRRFHYMNGFLIAKKK